MEQQIEIQKQVLRNPLETRAKKTPDGKGLIVTLVVTEGNEPIAHVYNIGEAGKQAISDAVLGGIVVPDGPLQAGEDRG